ncbi:MAG: oligosaccharide flippase family protein, partial [Campylobacterales bacterium]|nr:oligosaccharide flippase family protein [Campylobacterales bacterium]
FPKFQVPHTFLNTFASQMPVYAFGTFFAASVVGLYTLGARVVLAPMMLLSGSAAKVFNEKAAALYNEGGDLHTPTVGLLGGMAKKALIPFVLFVVFAPEIFAFVFGAPWREAGVYTQILSPWLFMVFIVSTVAFLPALYGRQRRALGIEIIYTLLRLVALGTGVVLADVHTALALFSAAGVVVLVYNLRWILQLTKGEA